MTDLEFEDYFGPFPINGAKLIKVVGATWGKSTQACQKSSWTARWHNLNPRLWLRNFGHCVPDFFYIFECYTQPILAVSSGFGLRIILIYFLALRKKKSIYDTDSLRNRSCIGIIYVPVETQTCVAFFSSKCSSIIILKYSTVVEIRSVGKIASLKSRREKSDLLACD